VVALENKKKKEKENISHRHVLSRATLNNVASLLSTLSAMKWIFNSDYSLLIKNHIKCTRKLRASSFSGSWTI